MIGQRWQPLRALWASDLYRHYLGARGGHAGLRARVVHVPARLMHKHVRYQDSIAISWDTQIGPGCFIGHFGGVMVNRSARIASNLNISHGVKIGPGCVADGVECATEGASNEHGAAREAS